MPDKYGSHADYMDWVKEDADSRQEAIENALHKAFSNLLRREKWKLSSFQA